MEKRLICTTAGNTLLERDAFAYLRVSGNTFTPQKAKNVQRGDMVLYHKECVDKTLVEVEDYLMQEDERYREAKGMLFERNREGVYVPRLRTGLWRGAPDSIRYAYENLESRILLEGSDFRELDYRGMNRRIQVALQTNHERGGPVPVTPSATKGWLLDTVAPADWNMFIALAEINPYFNQFLDDFRESQDSPPDFSNNLYDAYRLFVGIRRGIMRYLAAPKGRGVGGSGSHEYNDNGNGEESLFSLRPEINIILRYVLDEIDEIRIAAAVTSVRDIEYEIGRGFDTRGVKLTQGVLTGRQAPENINVKNIFEVINEEDVVCTLIADSIIKYTQKRIDMSMPAGSREREYVMNKFWDSFQDYTGFSKKKVARIKMIKEVERSAIKPDDSIDIERKPQLDTFADKLLREVVEGPSIVSDPGKRLAIPSGVRFLIESMNRVPDIIRDFYDVTSRINLLSLNENKLKEEKRRRKEIKRVIIEDYGVDPDQRDQMMSRQNIRDNFFHWYLTRFGRIPQFSQQELEEKIADYAKKRHLTIYTTEEETEIVRQYDFQDLLDLSWI